MTNNEEYNEGVRALLVPRVANNWCNDSKCDDQIKTKNTAWKAKNGLLGRLLEKGNDKSNTTKTKS